VWMPWLSATALVNRRTFCHDDTKTRRTHEEEKYKEFLRDFVSSWPKDVTERATCRSKRAGKVKASRRCGVFVASSSFPHFSPAERPAPSARTVRLLPAGFPHGRCRHGARSGALRLPIRVRCRRDRARASCRRGRNARRRATDPVRGC